MTPYYEVQSRPGPCYAVMRTGPKGGTRVVAVYFRKDSAESICTALNTERAVEL